MPNLRNINRNKKNDILETNKNLAPLGAYLEFRTRVVARRQARNSTSFANSNLTNYSHFSAGTITTTRRTFGMPLGSVIDIGGFPLDDGSEVFGQIASTSPLDVGVTGTGAREITIRGLDIYWEPLTISGIKLNGQTPVDISSHGFFRGIKLFIDEAGETGENKGDIYIAGTTATFVGGIPQEQVWYTMIKGENTSSYGHVSFGAHIRSHYIKGNNYTNATGTNPFVLEERYNFESFTGKRLRTIDGRDGLYSAGPLWANQPISYNFDAAAANFPKTDQQWIVNSATGTVEGTIYYELCNQDQIYDHFDVYAR